jgi:hypothetical protein
LPIVKGLPLYSAQLAQRLETKAANWESRANDWARRDDLAETAFALLAARNRKFNSLARLFTGTDVEKEELDMKRIFGAVAITLLLAIASASYAGGVKPSEPPPALGDGSVDSLSGNLRNLLLQILPSPLYVDNSHWGQQKEVQDGVQWKGKGLEVHPEPRTKLKNHGIWWKVCVTSPSLADSFAFNLHDVQTPEPGRMLFTVVSAFDVNVDYTREKWDEGLRLYSASVRGRMRVTMNLQCEATSRMEKKSGLLPDLVFRLRVMKADCNFEDFVVEHVGGVGGAMAKLMGDTARRALKLWHPSFEQHLKEKAEKAIVKAADMKEVRLSLSKLLDGKK